MSKKVVRELGKNIEPVSISTKVSLFRVIYPENPIPKKLMLYGILNAIPRNLPFKINTLRSESKLEITTVLNNQFFGKKKFTKIYNKKKFI